MSNPKPSGLTRKQLAEFLPDPRAVKAFELLVSDVSETLPTGLEAVSIEASNATSAANEALAQIASIKQDLESSEVVLGSQTQLVFDALSKLADLVALVALAPRQEILRATEDTGLGKNLEPAVQLGTLASQNHDSLNSVGFRTTAQQPFITRPGTLYWDTADGNKTLSLVMDDTNSTVIQQIGEEEFYRIKASSPITNGQVVMFSGTVGAPGALKGAPATGLAPATAMYVMGVATEDIANNGWGYVTAFGLVRGIDTTGGAEAWVDGQILYLNPAVPGGLTKTVPPAPAPKVIVASVVYAAANGSLFIRPSFGGRLGDFEGDVGFSALADKNLVQYDAVAGYWKNVAYTAIEIGTAQNLKGGVAGSIPYQSSPNTTVLGSALTFDGTNFATTGSINGGTTAVAGRYLNIRGSDSSTSGNANGAYLVLASTSASGSGIKFGVQSLAQALTGYAGTGSLVGGSFAATQGNAGVNTGNLIGVIGQITSSGTGNLNSAVTMQTAINLNSASTVPLIVGLQINAITAPTTGTTNAYGVQVGNITNATNAYGLWSNISSGTNKYNFYSAGTAANWFASDLTIYGGTAIPAGGTAGVGYKMSSTANFGVFFGSGAPTLSAAKGSLYLRSDGSSTSTRMYVNTDGATTWTNVVTAA